MPREISGLRIARSFISPTNTRVSRELDFQLGARQGISIDKVVGEIMPDPAGISIPSSTIAELTGNHTLHLETGSLENVPSAAAEDEDTIDTEIFFRQSLAICGNDDSSTEFRASLAYHLSPAGDLDFPKPLLTARNITHSGMTDSTSMDLLCHVTIYYTFVEFSLAELGLILARRS